MHRQRLPDPRFKCSLAVGFGYHKRPRDGCPSEKGSREPDVDYRSRVIASGRSLFFLPASGRSSRLSRSASCICVCGSRRALCSNLVLPGFEIVSLAAGGWRILRFELVHATKLITRGSHQAPPKPHLTIQWAGGVLAEITLLF